MFPEFEVFERGCHDLTLEIDFEKYKNETLSETKQLT